MKFSKSIKANRVKAIISEEVGVYSVLYSLRYEFYRDSEFVFDFTRYSENKEDVSSLFYELCNNGFVNILTIDMDKEIEKKLSMEFSKNMEVSEITIAQSDYEYLIEFDDKDKKVLSSLSYDKEGIIRLINQLMLKD